MVSTRQLCIVSWAISSQLRQEGGEGSATLASLDLIPRSPAAAVANGARFDLDTHLARHEGWFPGKDSTELEVAAALAAAALRDSSLDMVSYEINAFDVQLAGTRGVMCSELMMRICSRVFSQKSHSFSAPKTDQMGAAPGTVVAPRGGSGSRPAPENKSRMADD